MEPDFRALFEATPDPYLVLSPELRIVAVSDAYLRATMTRREELVGQGMFEAFPDNPDDPLADGVSNLRSSFERAIRSGRRDLMPLQRYDVRDERGLWLEKYWKPANWPVFDDGRLIAMVHHVTEVTEQAKTQTATPRTKNLGLIDRADLAAESARRLRLETEAKLAAVREASIAKILGSRSN
jgi:PAS domain S-box-containing protein